MKRTYRKSVNLETAKLPKTNRAGNEPEFMPDIGRKVTRVVPGGVFNAKATAKSVMGRDMSAAMDRAAATDRLKAAMRKATNPFQRVK